MKTRILLALSLALASPAIACVPPPPLPQLPGEDGKSYDARRAAAMSARDTASKMRWQADMFDRSAAVFIGRTTARADIPVDGTQGSEAIVTPLQSIRGAAVTGDVPLRTAQYTSCGFRIGGSAAWAKPGTYVVVFYGIPGDGGPPTNNGYVTDDILDERILKAIDDYATSASGR